MSEPLRVEEISILSHPRMFRQARRWLRRLVESAGWSVYESHELALALTEACTNAHRYAYAGRTDGPIDLRLELAPSVVRLGVRDYGTGFDRASYGVPDLSVPRERGYGLVLMRGMTDSLDYEKTEVGTRVWMVKRLRESSPIDATGIPPMLSSGGESRADE